MDKGNRKEIYLKTFFSIQEIDTDILKSLLLEAAEIDLR
jgi:hypothetical protein